jgi:hypothetical protein
MPKPEHPWRFSPGDIAYVRPCLPQYRVKLIEPITRVAKNGILFPCWLVVDDAGKAHEVLQLELSSKPVSIEKGRVKLLSAGK